MQKPRTKKAPASLTLAGTATTRPMESPKGSGPSVAPADLEERVAALEKAVSILALHVPDAVFLARQDFDRALERLEQRLGAAGTLVRIALPEATYDEVFAEWETLPVEAEARQLEVHARKAKHLRRIGVLPTEEVQS